MDLKKPLSLNKQVNQLILHKMDVSDVEYATGILSKINYYRFTGYATQFRDKDNPDDYYPGTSFDVVLRLYNFDAHLRSLIKPYLDMVELFARTKISYGFSLSKCLEPPHDQHYNSALFYYRGSHEKIFDLSLSREKENSKDSLFVMHHNNKYDGKMPLWVIVELLSFTNISKLYSAMDCNEQDKIAAELGTSRKILQNHLHCLANLRNKVAHASRLYNTKFNPPANLDGSFLQQNPTVTQNTLFAYIIALIRRLPNTEDKLNMVKDIHSLCSTYKDSVDLDLIGFPENSTALLVAEITR